MIVSSSGLTCRSAKGSIPSDLPEPYAPVPADAHDLPLLVDEHDSVNDRRVSGKGLDFFAGLQIPEPNRPVLTRRGEQVPGPRVDRADAQFVPLAGCRQLLGGDVPHPDRLVPTPQTKVPHRDRRRRN